MLVCSPLAPMPTPDRPQPPADAVPTWAHALVEAIQLPREVQPLKIGEQYAAIVPNGATVEMLQPGSEFDRERAGLAPVRPSGNPFFDDTDSFVRYILKHGNDASEIYADTQRQTIVAVLDWHDDEPGWGVHRATLKFRPDPDWQAWGKIDRRPMSQQEFAEFLEDQRWDIVTPSAAAVMEACSNLDVTTSAAFSSRTRLSDGTIALSYSEDQRTGQVKVPQTITLKLYPFSGSELYEVHARIRTSIKDQKLTFKVLIDRPHKVVETAIETEINKISEAVLKLGVSVFNGLAPSPLI
jgi:uncharacterized protein YfdQ (DUF2303 family)